MVKECPSCRKLTDNFSPKVKICRPCKSKSNKLTNPKANANRINYAMKTVKTNHPIGVYCFKEGKEIVYIGSSDNLPFRIYKHYQLNGSFDDGLNKLQRKMKYSWHVLWYGDSLEDAQHQEKALIQIHNPRFNKIKYKSYAA